MWEYSDAARLLTLRAAGTEVCVFCSHTMVRLLAQAFEANEKILIVQYSQCAVCGWWQVYRVHQREHETTAGVVEGYSAAIGSLAELDVADVAMPLRELRQYLMARQEKVKDVHPRKIEEVVASIFCDLGWTAHTTAYHADGGIDVILNGGAGETIGVQVKRYSDRIEAEQIRAFAGALILNRHTRGIFVTTSDYREGARRAGAEFGRLGIPIELLNADDFFAAMGIAQLKTAEIDMDAVRARLLLPGAHLGSGLERPLRDGEDISKRPIVASLLSRDEFIDLIAAEATEPNNG